MADNQPPGSIPGRLPIDFRPRRSILLPYNDLSIDQGLDQFLPILDQGFHLGIVLPYGMGPSEPKVLQMDANGALLVSLVGAAALSAVNVSQWNGAAPSAAFLSADGMANATGIFANAYGDVFNGATWDRARSASAANLATQSQKGIALTASPGEWSAQGNAALGAQSTATQAAGAAGVRHIGVGFSILVTSQAAPAAGTLTINLRDGATGVGGILEQYTIQIPAALYAPIVIARSGLSIVGSAATAMTLESSALYAAVGVSLNLEGYDAA